MKQFITLILISSSFVYSAQGTPGYLGKKIILDFSLKVATPTFRKQYIAVIEDHGLNVKQDVLDLGFKGSAMYAVNRNFLVGGTIGFDRFRTNANRVYSINTNDITFTDDVILDNSNIQALPFTLFSVIPKIEFAGKGSLLPMGLSHQVGIGYFNARVDKRAVFGKVQSYDASGILSPLTPTNNVENLLDPSIKSFNGVTFLYAMNMRLPISDRLMINFGIQYTYNRFIDTKTDLKVGALNSTIRPYHISRSDFDNALIEKYGSNYISFCTGISITL
jgi:hypothetical protein